MLYEVITRLEIAEQLAVPRVGAQRIRSGGVESRDVLAELTDAPLDNDHFRWLTGQEITVAGVPVRALRVNYVGELGWELHPAMGDLETRNNFV